MKATQKDLAAMRSMVERLGWGEFMLHVGSLMAEQSDKVGEEQSSKLFSCSNTIHALDKFFQELNTFEYSKMPPGMEVPLLDVNEMELPDET